MLVLKGEHLAKANSRHTLCHFLGLAGFSKALPHSPSLPAWLSQQGPRETLFFPGRRHAASSASRDSRLPGSSREMEASQGPLCCLITFGPSFIRGNLRVTHSSLHGCPAGRSTGCVVRQSWIQMLLLLPSGELGFGACLLTSGRDRNCVWRGKSNAKYPVPAACLAPRLQL